MPPSPTDVVTCFVVRNQTVLLLKRSQKVGTYRGYWSGVSGYLETPEPIDQAWTELREELGASRDDLSLERRGDTLDIVDEETGRRWRVHPFRFSATVDFEPRLDWENQRMRWVNPEAISRLKTVPGLMSAWERVSS